MENNTKLSLSIVILLFTISVIMIGPVFAAGHTAIVASQTQVVGNSLKADITTAANIPVDGLATPFGYAIATGSLTNNVFVFVTHLPIDDSSFEDMTSGFHGHVLDLRLVDQADPADACTGVDAEIDVASSQANTGFDGRTPYMIRDNQLNIFHVTVDSLNSGVVSDVVAFTLTPLPDANDPQHLCVDLVGFGVGQ